MITDSHYPTHQWEHTPEPSPLQPLVRSHTAVRKSKAKPLAYVFASCIFITAIVVVYALTHEGTGSGLQVNNRQWRQMESTHAFASNIVPIQWVEQDACDNEHQFTLTLALKQSNIDTLHSEVMAVSDPQSDSFRKYWTADQVREHFAPQQETIDTVIQWLEQNGFTSDNDRVSMHSEHSSTVKVRVSCSEANALLNAEYVFYENTETGRSHLRVKDGMYHVPESIYDHIDFIRPTIRFPLRDHIKDKKKLDISELLSVPESGSASLEVNIPEGVDTVDTVDVVANRLTSSDSYNTPSTLYDLYGVRSNLVSQLQSSSVHQSLASFNMDYWSDDDLEMAFDTLDYIGGNSLDQMTRDPSGTPSGHSSEATLDTQYITAVGAGLSTTVYYVDDDEDPFTALAENIMSSDDPPSVLSISYGADEYLLGDRYCERANGEFGKLALIGTTIVVSSGDAGTRGNDRDCEDGDTYISQFPASAPYVTAVGGTQGGSAGGSSTGETAWFYGGGGFSNYFDIPSWQSSAVEEYFETDVTFPDQSRYTQNMRGVPDISAQAVDYVVVVEKDYYVVSGTSAAAPLVAGMIAVINAGRAENGDEALGFLNPTLYALYDERNRDEYFNDVTSGYNEGCEADDEIGWYAASGWDPVTGVGTPRFDELYDALVSSSHHRGE